METNSNLKGLFLSVVGQTDQALLRALELSLVKVDDLSEADPKHRLALIGLGSDKIHTPARFVKTASPSELATLLGSKLNAAAAQAEVDVRLARNDPSILTHIIDEGLYRRAEGWPDNIQKLVIPILSDPAKTNDDRWDRARRNMSEAHQVEVVKIRSVTKRKATVAAITAGTQERVKHTDPLLEAIATEDTKRMRGIALDTLKPERWEKIQAEWLLSTNAKIKAFLTKLPLSFLTPDIMREGLNAAAEAKLDRWTLSAPKWAIPKAILKTLTPAAAAHWLKEAACSSVKFDAPITPVELTEELSPMLVMEALQDAEVGKVMGWLDGLRKARKVLKYVGAPSKPTAEEKKMLESISTGLRRLYTGNADAVEAYASDESVMMTLIRWLLGMNDDDLARLGGTVLNVSEVVNSIAMLFDEEQVTNFSGDI
jgi:hypothetical protein